MLATNQIKRHFRALKPRGRKNGEYCERCGCLIGKGFRCEVLEVWRGFNVCDSCFSDKINNKKATPDLEDLILAKQTGQLNFNL